MPDIIPFTFSDMAVRVIELNGEPWFVAKDVATVLGYSNTKDAVGRHCKAAISGGVVVRDSMGREQNMTIIPERDVYRLVMRSRLPSAERFEEWVVGEVLPSIRKTGSYAAPALPDFTNPAEAARAWAEEYDRAEDMKEERDILDKTLTEVERDFTHFISSKGSISLADTARLLNAQHNAFICWLLEKKHIFRNQEGALRPSAQMRQSGIMVLIARPVPGQKIATLQTRVTSRGVSHLDSMYPKHMRNLLDPVLGRGEILPEVK